MTTGKHLLACAAITLATAATSASPAGSAVVVTRQSLDNLVRLQFASADRDRDGVLTFGELSAASGSYRRQQAPGLDLVDWIRWERTDADRDGRIAPEDVSAAYIAAFEDHDRDADGTLTQSELQASRAERMFYVCPARGDADCAEAERKMAAVRNARATSGRDFERLDARARGYYRFSSALDRPLYTAVRDYRSWHAMWDRIAARHGPKPLSPSVDFSKDMILIAATGAKPSGGYGIQIVSVRDTGKELVATAVRTSPGPRCGATAAITAPADIVRVPISRKPVRWTFRERLTDCS
jgi:hypothetical protein